MRTMPNLRTSIEGHTTDEEWSYEGLVTWLNLSDEPRQQWPAWWFGNTPDSTRPERFVAAEGLPVPLRPMYDADKDVEADTALEASDPIFGMVWTWLPNDDRRGRLWVPHCEAYGQYEAMVAADDHGITTRELRARRPLRDALGVECCCTEHIASECPKCHGPGRIYPEYVSQHEDAGTCNVCAGTGEEHDTASVEPGDLEAPCDCQACYSTGRTDGFREPDSDYDEEGPEWLNGPSGGTWENATYTILMDWRSQNLEGPFDWQQLVQRELARRHSQKWSAGYPHSEGEVPMGKMSRNPLITEGQFSRLCARFGQQPNNSSTIDMKRYLLLERLKSPYEYKRVYLLESR